MANTVNAKEPAPVRLYDITQPVYEGMPLYPGDPVTAIQRVADVGRGDAFTLSVVSMSAHAGTHLDAPSHLFADGRSVDEVPLEVLVGDALVVSLPGGGQICREDLEQAAVPPEVTRLLLKTRAAHAERPEPPSWLAEDACRWMVQRGIALVGTDQISVDAPQDASLTAHHALLSGGVVVLEGLDLGHIPAGRYTLVCLPLKLSGCEGAPARAVLMECAGLPR